MGKCSPEFRPAETMIHVTIRCGPAGHRGGQPSRTWLQSFPGRDEPLAILERNHIMSAPVHDVAQAMTSPAVKGRGALQEVTYPGAGSIEVPRVPMRFSAAKVESPRPAPGLGEHNTEVLGALLGFSEEKLAALIKDGVLVQQVADGET
jgi:crotonobetainyl-CoA:carnitine CoA-transferase CaiB-like acyl-CoA transferase